MKKLSAKARARLTRKARWGNLTKARTSQPTINEQNRAAVLKAKATFNAIRQKLPTPVERIISESRLTVTDFPAKFDLHTNYEETLALIMELRFLHRPRRSSGLNGNQSRRWRGLLNLARIEDIDPATGLVLAAELDSYRRHISGLRSNDDNWHENVRTYFLESGLFELLGISPQRAHPKPASGPERRVLKYRKGREPDGEQADRLRRELEDLCGESFGPRVLVNNALCEAMTNSHHHAYPEEQSWWPLTPPGNWWASCAWTPSTETMHMMLYDQGVGIPKTLPRSKHWASTLPIIDRLDPEHSDAGLIEAALELRRTSTNIEGRGRGLAEMAEWVDRTESGFLRILSGSGRVTYRPGKVVQRSKLRAPFCGTLVEWEIQRGS